MPHNTFYEALKIEQKRIQRLIDLSTLQEPRGSLQLERRGDKLYAYERWQKKGQPAKKTYLGTPTSAPVRELFSLRLKKDRLDRLQGNKKLLQRMEQQYRCDDFASVVADMPKSYRMIARENSFDERYEELRKWASAHYPKNPAPFPPAKSMRKTGRGSGPKAKDSSIT